MKVSEMRYKPWGEVRYAWTNAPANTSPAYALTRYTFTGQYSHMDNPSTPASEGFGLMFYNARMYDPALGRFTSADTIVPGGVQGYDRYAYVNNNPIRYNDPSRHVCSDPEDESGGCEGGGAKLSNDYTSRWLRSYLKDRYDWRVADDFTESELNVIYQVGHDIETYADGLTGGSGLDWMRSALGNTTIIHGYRSDGRSLSLPLLGENFGPIILLDQNWLTHQWGAKVLFAHELGHVWDINSGFAASGELNSDLGGSSWCFLCSPGDGVPQWRQDYHRSNGDAYGNSGRNEYFAEAFSATIYNPNDTPSGVSAWIDNQIIIDLIGNLVPGGMQ